MVANTCKAIKAKINDLRSHFIIFKTHQIKQGEEKTNKTL